MHVDVGQATKATLDHFHWSSINTECPVCVGVWMGLMHGGGFASTALSEMSYFVL